MVLFNLRNGKTIELTIEELLFMTDDDLHNLEGSTDLGECIEDPFHLSSLGGERESIIDDFELPLTNIPASVKLNDKEIMAADY